MMRVIFTRIARQELEDAARYYDLEFSGLGRRFKEEVRKAALRIADYPAVTIASATTLTCTDRSTAKRPRLKTGASAADAGHTGAPSRRRGDS